MAEIRFKPSDIGTVVDGGVTTVKLADDAVTSPKIKDGAVTEPKVGADAITRTKIKDGEVLEAKVVDKAFVKTNKISGLKRTLTHGYDPTTGELVVVVDDEPNP